MASVTRTSGTYTATTVNRAGGGQLTAAVGDYAAFEQAVHPSGGGSGAENNGSSAFSQSSKDDTKRRSSPAEEEVTLSVAEIPGSEEVPFSYAHVAAQLRAVYERQSPASPVKGIFIPLLGELPTEAVADEPPAAPSPRVATHAYRQAQKDVSATEPRKVLIDL